MNVTIQIRRPSLQRYAVGGATLADAHAVLSGQRDWGRHIESTQAVPTVNNGIVESVLISGTARIRMPRWTNLSAAPPSEQTEWKRMWQALWGHEMGHHQVVLDTANMFRTYLLGDNAMPEDVFREDQAGFRRDINMNQRRYDRQTRHGQTQGVSLNY